MEFIWQTDAFITGLKSTSTHQIAFIVNALTISNVWEATVFHCITCVIQSTIAQMEKMKLLKGARIVRVRSISPNVFMLNTVCIQITSVTVINIVRIKLQRERMRDLATWASVLRIVHATAMPLSVHAETSLSFPSQMPMLL